MKFTSKLLIFISASIAALFLGILIYILIFPAKSELKENSYLAVVFGAGITKSGEPSLALKSRLDKSVEFYKVNKIKIIIVSGKIAETFVMKNYLTRNGVKLTDIVSDFNGRNTETTVANTRHFLATHGIKQGPVFISQKYHLPRISLLAYKKHIRGATFIAADPRKIDQDEYAFFLARETLAFLKSLLFDN